MLTSITTSQFTERLIYLMLVDGHYRKYLSRLHERLGETRLNVVRAFERSEWSCSWSLPTGCSSGRALPMSRIRWRSRKNPSSDGIMLAPGAIFRPHLERSPWMRFNVTVCEDARVQGWLGRLGSSAV